MKFVLRMVLTVAVAVVGASVASAQGRPGGFAAGGFGFGNTTNAYAMIATNKVLQEEIKVTDEQKTKLEEAMKPIAAKRNELLGGAGGQRRPGGGQGGQRPMLTEEQRKERDEKIAKLNEETKKAVEGVLDEKQGKRLSQINVQLLGFAAYTDKGVQEKLKLDDGQKEKIKSINEEYTKDRNELFREGGRAAFGGGRRPGGQEPSEEDKKKAEEFTKKSDNLRKEAEDKIVSLLSADQKNSWKELVGEKADLTKIRAGNVRPMQRRDN